MFEEYLEKALSEEKIPNTLLFSGPCAQCKKIALWLASQLLNLAAPRSLTPLEAGLGGLPKQVAEGTSSPLRMGESPSLGKEFFKIERLETHPDFHSIAPEGKSGLHSIESIRNAIDISHSAPYSAPAKVFLIESAESMQPAAANALLKTLEEPAPDSYWILLSERPREILPTIVSRCAKLTSQVQSFEPQTPEFQEAKSLILTILETKPTYPKLFLTLERIGELMEEKDASPLFIAIAEAFCDLERKNSPGRWQEAFEQARLGFERNIKLATCLECFFLTVNYLSV